ncbi:MAG: methyltransferase [Pseudomonadota bacterium]
MARSRLTEALNQGLIARPDGMICVLGPRQGYDLSALDALEITVVQGFRSDYLHWTTAGFAVEPEIPAGPFAGALIVLPRARDLAREWIAGIAAALPAGAPVWVDGQKTDGVDSLYRACRKAFACSEAMSMAHGKLFAFKAAAAPPDWQTPDHRTPEGFATAAGAFSADAVDPGSKALAAVLPARMPGRVADLGAGWGYLASEVLSRDGPESLHLFEADHAALAAARRNVPDARAVFHWQDVSEVGVSRDFDAVVCNPPFHVGRDTRPELGQAFIDCAAGLLKPSGRLWLVANRHLPYEGVLSDRFRTVDRLEGSDAYKLFRAERPLTRR